jgi:hypothetical protein
MPATAKTKLTRIRLREDYTSQTAGELTVDREACVVKNIKISGLVSRNGRRYLLEAYRAALPLYEGALCNVDHIQEHEKDVPFDRRFGVWRNVRLTADGLRGDLNYNPDHPKTAQFLWWAENCPEAVGVSHLADGLYDTDPTGVKVVRSIERVYSVDLVADPATNKGLAEAAMFPDAATDTPAETPAPLTPAPGSDTGDWKSKLADAMKSLCLDDAKSPDEKWSALEQIFDAMHPPEDEAKDGEPPLKEDKPEGDDVDDKAMESLRKTASTDPNVKRLLESHDRLKVKEAVGKKEAKARQLCKAAGLPAIAMTEVFLESLVHAADEKQMGRLIEDRRVLASSTPSKRPTSAAPTGGKEATFDEFLAGLKNID